MFYIYILYANPSISVKHFYQKPHLLPHLPGVAECVHLDYDIIIDRKGYGYAATYCLV